MTRHACPAGKSQRLCPVMETLERREVLSARPMGQVASTLLPAAQVQQFASVLYPTGTPQPTSAELQRQTFVYRTIGRYTIGPPRFNTQKLTITGSGRGGVSTDSLNARFQYVVIEPADAAQPAYGEINILPRNTLQSGSSLILEMQGSTDSTVKGLPTHLNWTPSPSSNMVFGGTGYTLPGSGNFPVNYLNSQGLPVSPAPGSAGGGAASSVNNGNMGYGEIVFRYIPDRQAARGTLGSGTVVIVVQGLLNTTGAQNPVDARYS